MEQPEEAELLLLNTCGFIQPAVEEAIEAALELAEAKTPDQLLVVAGCLVGRYGKKLAASLPEADLLLAPGEAPNLLRQHLADAARRAAWPSARRARCSAGPIPGL